MRSSSRGVLDDHRLTMAKSSLPKSFSGAPRTSGRVPLEPIKLATPSELLIRLLVHLASRRYGRLLCVPHREHPKVVWRLNLALTKVNQ